MALTRTEEMDFGRGKHYHPLAIGHQASFTITVMETDVTLLAGISGGFNPMHANEAFDRGTPIKGRIAHSALG